MGLADKIRENHELAATTQQALRNGRRVIRRIAEETPISVPAVVEAHPQMATLSQTAWPLAKRQLHDSTVRTQGFRNLATAKGDVQIYPWNG